MVHEPLHGNIISRAIYDRASSPTEYPIFDLFVLLFTDRERVSISENECRLNRKNLLKMIGKQYNINQTEYTRYTTRDLGHGITFLPDFCKSISYRIAERVHNIEKFINHAGSATNMCVVASLGE